MKKIYQTAIMAFIILCGLHFAGCNPSDGNNPSEGETPSGGDTPSTSQSELWPAGDNNGKWGYINKKGIFVIQPAYESAQYFSSGYAAVKLNNTYMFIDEEGKLHNVPSVTDVSGLGFVNDYFIVESGKDRWGILDKSFNYVIPPIYDALGGMPYHGYDGFAVGDNGLVAFRYTEGEKVGFLDVKTGKVAIQPQYQYAYYPFLDGYAPVAIEDGGYEKWGIINASGEYVVQPVYRWICNLGKKRFAYSDGEYWGIMNEKGEIIVNPIYDDVEIVFELIGYYYPVSDLIPVLSKSTERYGYIDMDGNEKIPFQYDDADPFAEGYAVVSLNNRCIVIDQNGKTVFMLNEGEWAYDRFRNGLLITEEYNDKTSKYTYRYRDTEGNIVYFWEYAY